MPQVPVRITQANLDVALQNHQWHSWFSEALLDGVLQNCQVKLEDSAFLVLPTGGRRRLPEGFSIDLPKNVQTALSSDVVKPFETSINIPDKFKRYLTKNVRESIYGVYIPKNKINKK